jgi:NitT/TauT family transport system substrate-binding protein
MGLSSTDGELRRTSVPRSFLRLAAALVAPLILVACQAASSPSAQPLTKVALQLEWVPQAQFAGFYVALDKGYYAAEGLDVSILGGGPDVRTIDQLANGTAQFGLESPLGMYLARDAGVPVKLIAQVDQKDGFVKIMRKDSGISKPEDFRGKKVGVWGDEWEFYPLMKSVNIDPQTDLTLVQQAFTMDAFLNGELDVASATLWNEYNVVLEAGVEADDLNVINYSDYGFGIPHGGIVTTEEYLTANRDVAVRFVRASIKGWLDAYDDQSEAIDIVMKVVQGGTEQSAREHQELMLAAMQTLQLPDGFPEANFGKPDPAYYATAAQIAEDYDLVENPIPVEAGYDLSVWDDTTK